MYNNFARPCAGFPYQSGIPQFPAHGRAFCFADPMTNNQETETFVSCVFSGGSFSCNCQCERCVELEECQVKRDKERELRRVQVMVLRQSTNRVLDPNRKQSAFRTGKSTNSKLLDRTNGRCWYCGITLKLTCNVCPEMFTRDHVIPNGNNDPSNLVASCHSCNSTKGNRPVEYLRNRMRMKIARIPRFSSDQKKWMKDVLGVDAETDQRFHGSQIKFYGETL